MSAQVETARGGCLDAIVGVLSLGYFGVETEATKIYPRPTSYTQAAGLPSREEAPIIIINRRIVRNKRLK